MSQLQVISQNLLAKYSQLRSSERPTVPERGKDPMEQAELVRNHIAEALSRAKDGMHNLQRHYAVAVPGGLTSQPAPFQHYHQKIAELQELLHYIENVALNPIA
jgi:hypothetical protein